MTEYRVKGGLTCEPIYRFQERSDLRKLVVAQGASAADIQRALLAKSPKSLSSRYLEIFVTRDRWV